MTSTPGSTGQFSVLHIGCSIEGCEGSHYGKGWCSKHYQKWYRRGNPLAADLRTKHGMHQTAEFAAWTQAHDRCSRPARSDYPRYGGRGITVCDEWDDFSTFFSDMGPRPSSAHSLDRIDNDGPYSPGNCRWATAKEQCRNKSNNFLLTFQGETLSLVEWTEKTGLARSTIRGRVLRGWSAERALTTPPTKGTRTMTRVALLLITALTAATLIQSAKPAVAAEGMGCPVPGATFVDSWGAPRDGGSRSHQGVDMMAADGDPIYAPEDGVYRQHGAESFYLDGVSGTTYFGTHLQGHIAPDGPVEAGQEIALVGHTGNASPGAPHLHFEIHPGGGDAVDPYPATLAACNGPSPDQVALQFVAAVGAPPAAPYTPVETADFIEALGHERPTMVEAYAAASYFNATAERVAEPSWPYQTGEVRRWWNATRDPDITRPQAAQVTAWLNAVVEARLGQYLLAVYLSRVQVAQHSDLVYRWSGVAQCESGGNWYINTGNGYYGGVQFSLPTWRSVGGQGYPHENSPGEQAYRAEILKDRSGLGQWPVCGRLYRG